MSSFSDCDIDAATLAAARRGERDAAAAVYRIYSGAVYTLARRILQHPESAEEVLQDTFVEVLRHLDSYRGDAPLGAWIRRIAVNKALAQLRSGWHRYARPLEAAGERAGGERTDAAAELAQALARLQPAARAVVWLHDVEGYTHREIAALMDKTPSYSKSQLARAHRLLQTLAVPREEHDRCMPLLSNC